jgi:hypothetical protein
MGFICVSDPPPALVAPPSPCLQPQGAQSVPPRIAICELETLRLVIERSKRLQSVCSRCPPANLTSRSPQLQAVSTRVSALLDRLLQQRKGRLQLLQALGASGASGSELLRQKRVLLAAALQNQAQIRDSLQVVRPLDCISIFCRTDSSAGAGASAG